MYVHTDLHSMITSSTASYVCAPLHPQSHLSPDRTTAHTPLIIVKHGGHNPNHKTLSFCEPHSVTKNPRRNNMFYTSSAFDQLMII